MSRITPFLWFDTQSEEAAQFYTSIFPNSKILGTTPGPDGRMMTAQFELDGLPFVALNGGPLYQFTEAISFSIACADQAEVDYYWERLGEGGDPAAQQCGWLKDRFGVSWQVVPTALPELLGDPDPERAGRAMQAMLQMKKIDIDALRRAANG